ncbi:MAG: serine protease [Myxococcales bacterium]|nr:serine protease [Myxococcales bacterium]
MRRFAWCAAAAAPFVSTSCVDPNPVGRLEAPAVYGEDDRRDVFEHDDASLRARTDGSIVALMQAEALMPDGDGSYVPLAPTLGEAQRLCAGQRFAEQPTAAFCSGTLIDDDLVLTAGHCVEASGDCSDVRLVFDYYFVAPGRLARIEREDVFACRRIVTRRLEESGLDYAVMQLDRPATPSGRSVAPVRLEDRPLERDRRVVVIGFGSGLPAKIDDGGRVVDPRASRLDYFHATTDTFGGNSGSGVFDEEGRIVGILVRGETDYVPAGSCYVVNELPDSGTGGAEDVVYVRRAIDALCREGWPSERLCGRGSSCGDGICSGMETPEDCPDDCAAAACPDGLCQLTEDESSCPADCAGGASSGPPSGWTCPAGWYDAREGCDCGCGVRDPDCDVPGQRVYGCTEGQSCDASGRCTDAPAGGGVWLCSPEYYGTSDGCDCECGTRDPDCDDPSQPVLNCPDGYLCGGPSGTCVDESGMPPGASGGDATCAVMGTAGPAMTVVLAAWIAMARRRRARRRGTPRTAHGRPGAN